ncbi:serine hydrolase domain-containing protein [Aurantiacibacter flavus]|uniref:Serine hydrolase domain-containing protein n=1 Tax=Aurantiacibacter flavus TaxID=3145232 RepID=A0ABV0CSG7_9SPHN
MVRAAAEFDISRRSLLRGGAMLGAGALAGGVPFTQAALAQGTSGQWPRVARLVSDFVARGWSPNAVVALGWGQNPPEYLGQGDTTFTSGIRADADSLFRIYSMTKPITGMAAMMLIEEGLLSLDQPVADILPAFAEMKVQKVYDGPITEDNLEPAVRPITIRHLLTHTAGLGYSIVQQGPLAQAYAENGLNPAQVSRLEVPGGLNSPPAPSLEVFADRLATMPLVYQPGTHWSYSVALDLMGRVIEVASGLSFDAFLQERIFDPCDMSSTWFRVPESEKARLTANYFLLDGQPLPIDLPANSVYLDQPAFPFGGAGLVSSPRDYDRFLMMLAGFGHIEGRRVMSEPAVRLGTSNLFPDTLAPDGGFTSGGRTFGFGAGGLVGMDEAAGLFGWFGAAGTAGLVNMKTGLRQTFMTQYMPADMEMQNAFPQAVAADAVAMER